MYSGSFPGSIPVALTGNSPQPVPKYPPSPDQPKTNSGSPTYPLDLYAALSSDRKFLRLAVVNATESEQDFDLNASGIRLAGPFTLSQLTGATLDAANRVGQPPQVEIKQTAIDNVPRSLTVAPISVNIYSFPVAETAK